MFLSLLQVITTPSPTTTNHVLSLQSLTTLGAAAGGATAITPLYSIIGQAIKQHPKIKNDWLRWILPLMGFLIGCAIIAGYIILKYVIDPITILGIFALTIGGAFGADVVYGAAKGNPGLLPSGPANHPADYAAATSATVSIPQQAVTATISAPPTLFPAGGPAGPTTTTPTNLTPVANPVQAATQAMTEEMPADSPFLHH